MAPLFAPLGSSSSFGNTGITGQGMPYATAPVVGQTARRRNGRPDTPEELYADAVARGEIPPGTAGPVGTGTTLFNQPQQFPGNTFGTNDWSRAGTYLANDLYNQYGGLLNQGQSLYGLGQNLYNQYAGLGDTARLNEQMGNVANFNADVLGGRMPQAIEQLTAPYLARASAAVNAQADTARRQALDQLPRGGLAAEAVMGANDSAVKGIADAAANLYGSVAPVALQNALQGGNLNTGLSLLSGQGNVFGQLGSNLGQLGTMLAQQGLGPWSIVQGLGGLLNQRRGIDVTADAAKGK